MIYLTYQKNMADKLEPCPISVSYTHLDVYKRQVFISPCAAKVTATKMPLGTQKSAVDAVLAVSEIYPKLFPLMKEVADAEPVISSEAGRIGLSWGRDVYKRQASRIVVPGATATGILLIFKLIISMLGHTPYLFTIAPNLHFSIQAPHLIHLS